MGGNSILARSIKSSFLRRRPVSADGRVGDAHVRLAPSIGKNIKNAYVNSIVYIVNREFSPMVGHAGSPVLQFILARRVHRGCGVDKCRLLVVLDIVHHLPGFFIDGLFDRFFLFPLAVAFNLAIIQIQA